MEDEDGFAEEPLTQNGELSPKIVLLLRISSRSSNAYSSGELVLWVARGVGFLVAIVAILLCFMIMMIARTLISLVLHRCGVLGVVACTSASVWLAMKCRNMPFKTIWAILSSSCS